MQNILITRDQNRSYDLAKTLEDSGFTTFFEPLFKVQKILPTIDTNAKIAAIIVTSFNACDALDQVNLDKNIKIFAVGKQTAQKLTDLKFNNITIASQESAISLKNTIINANIDKSKIILYFHGPIISLDFAQELQPFNIKVKNILSYKLPETTSFSKELLNFSQNNQFDFTLIFSQNSAKIFLNLAKQHNMLEYFKASKLLCFSEKILHQVKNLGFDNSASFSDLTILQEFYDRSFK